MTRSNHVDLGSIDTILQPEFVNAMLLWTTLRNESARDEIKLIKRFIGTILWSFVFEIDWLMKREI